ncbi:methylated-DNA--[protein]-cysteine S-methyltransferase [Hephaestia mangrovi]|uniref:methylated-DNA--[protein]-cysteine S-methyltransferase n=1 Tax=Hephaestia mangrovi TaxID=2873268 RepID=UPI001CA7639E|nr:methylated-DNA--[protein]-cysteine S-methyltransferase [Hephaestia mangrovi]MBY8828796.1 methylated-DNA--[protein]-cysteine S-methyltransferase [Hephaestia mangrovi]
MTDVYRRIESPVGRLTLVASDRHLVAIAWQDDAAAPPFGAAPETAPHPVLDQTERQLAAYFAGERQDFDLPLDFRGTDFQRRVWHALLTIPFGETRSYRDIAVQLGQPSATRAVGAANGRNPIPIVAPCHRVIGANGSLTGFGGGLENKAFLLDLEQAPRLL